MNMVAIENAVAAWVSTATGATVILDKQDGPRPARPFATVTVQSILPLGAVDAVHTNYDGSRAAGQEIELKVTGVRELTAMVQFFTASANGDACARHLAAKAVIALRKPSVREALRTAFLTPLGFGTIRDLSRILESDFEGRASVEVRFFTEDSASEFTGYITTAQVDITVEGGVNPIHETLDVDAT